jgi:DNA methylase
MNFKANLARVEATRSRKLPPKISEGRLSPFIKVIRADARSIPLPALSADLVVTSPPYWLKRDYDLKRQIGQEPTADKYVRSLIECMGEWKRILPVWGSIFINIGDTYHRGSLAGGPPGSRRRRCGMETSKQDCMDKRRWSSRPSKRSTKKSA